MIPAALHATGQGRLAPHQVKGDVTGYFFDNAARRKKEDEQM
jgi:hypothetical protein